MRTLVAMVIVLCASSPVLAQLDMVNLLTVSSANDPKATESAVAVALKSEDARVRAVAARVANVRRLTSLLGAIGALADRESSPDAAREELRAMVMLGGLRQVDRAFYISDRFSKRLDADVATAAAHLGPEAIDAFFLSMQKRSINRYAFFLGALWNKPQLAAGVAARLLAENPDAFETFLYANQFEPRVLIETGTLASALSGTNLDVRADTVWFLIRHALRKSTFDPALKEAIGALRVPRDNADLIVSVELLRRAIGLPRRDFVEFRYALKDRLVQFRVYLAPKQLLELFDKQERLAVTDLIGERKDSPSTNLPPFVLPSALPEGMAASIVSMTGCKEGWLGNAKVKIDDYGYVVVRDLSGVKASDSCKQTLNMLLDYSITENRLISAPRQSDSVSLVHSPKGPMCFDEGHVPSIPTAYVYGMPAMHMPKASRRITPDYPAGVERKPQDVIVEAMVSAQGCVRAVRVVDPAIHPAFNNAALLAVQQWQFEPAMINTYPVDVLFDVTVEFR